MSADGAAEEGGGGADDAAVAAAAAAAAAEAAASLLARSMCFLSARIICISARRWSEIPLRFDSLSGWLSVAQ